MNLLKRIATYFQMKKAERQLKKHPEIKKDSAKAIFDETEEVSEDVKNFVSINFRLKPDKKLKN